jgi:hypothetical protein
VSANIFRRLEAIERALAGLPATAAADYDDEDVLAEWRRLRADPPPPSPLDPDIAAMSDLEAVDRWRRICKGERL